MTIKAVFWDLAGVVLFPIRGTFNTLLAERLEAPLEMIDRIMGSPQDILWDLGEMEDDDFYTHLLNELKMPLEKKAVIARFVLKDFFIDQDMLDYIKRLRDSYSTILITNFPNHLRTFLKTDWQIDGAFDHVIISSEVKLIKPDPRIYQLALERAGCFPEESVFIDDREVNVRAAEKLGIRGILFQDKDQAISDLEQILNHPNS
jgi:epoxide hydrolase-like predicted phosphatase